MSAYGTGSNGIKPHSLCGMPVMESTTSVFGYKHTFLSSLSATVKIQIPTTMTGEV